MLTLTEAKRVFHYEPGSGHLIWKVGRNIGQRAGTLHKTMGYRQVKVNGTYYNEHRIIMLIVNGDLPEGMQVDHINHDRADNRLVNLRFVTHTQNGRNTKLPVTNTTGVIGVSYKKKYDKYYAQIYIKGKNIYLGWHDTLEEAAAARAEAEIKYGFHPNHGL